MNQNNDENKLTKNFQLKVSKYVNINFIFGKILVKI